MLAFPSPPHKSKSPFWLYILILLLGGCSSQPTIVAYDDVNAGITNADGAIQGAQKDLQKSPVAPGVPEAQLKLTNARTSLSGASSAASKASTLVVKQSKDLATAKSDAQEYKNKYDKAWIGGKTWKMIYWITGIGFLLIVLDTMLFLFTGSGTLNPLTLFINLISRLFKK